MRPSQSLSADLTVGNGSPTTNRLGLRVTGDLPTYAPRDADKVLASESSGSTPLHVALQWRAWEAGRLGGY